MSARGAIGIVCLGLLGLSSARAAEDLTLTAEVDARKVGVADTVQLTISVSGRSLDQVQDITVPALSNLRVVGRDSAEQYSFANGPRSASKTYILLLQPKAVGKAEIGAVRVQLKSGTVKTTPPIAIEVVAGRVRSAPQASPSGSADFGEDPYEAMQRGSRAPRVSVELEAAPRKVYVGQPVLLTYWRYTQVVLRSDASFVEEPKYPGFWAEEVTRPARVEWVTRGGERYQRDVLLQRLLFPTKGGRLTIPTATLRLYAVRQGFFGADVVPLDRQAAAVTIEAMPIPEAPGFSGAVGSFRATAAVDRAAVDLGEAVTLRFTLSGRGNLKWIDKGPELNVPGLKTFPPQIKDDVKVTAAGMSGSRTWEYVVIPETAGALSVPPLTLSYFDPEKGQLAKTESAALPLEVRGGGVAGRTAVALPRAALAPSGSGALPLRTELDESVASLPEIGPRGLGAIVAGALLAHALLVVAGTGWGRLGRRRAGGTAPRSGQRSAVADVRRAGRKTMSKEAAATLIEKALVDVFGEQGEREPQDERERAARAVLDEVRFLRYAPQLGDYGEKIREVAGHAEEVIRRHA